MISALILPFEETHLEEAIHDTTAFLYYAGLCVFPDNMDCSTYEGGLHTADIALRKGWGTII